MRSIMVPCRAWLELVKWLPCLLTLAGQSNHPGPIWCDASFSST